MFPAFTNSVILFYEGEEGGVALRWRVADVSDEDAVVRLKQGGETTNYRSLRTLFRALSGDAEIVLLKDCALTEPLTIAAGTAVKLVSNGDGTTSVGDTVVRTGGTTDSRKLCEQSEVGVPDDPITTPLPPSPPLPPFPP